MFANAELARAAAEKEIEEARARTAAQRALAEAQAQAAHRTLVVAREKAGNEAKSLFMSLMMHEVRLYQLKSLFHQGPKTMMPFGAGILGKRGWLMEEIHVCLGNVLRL